MEVLRLLIKKAILIIHITSRENYRLTLKRIDKIDIKLNNSFIITGQIKKYPPTDLYMSDYECADFYVQINDALNKIKANRIIVRKNFENRFIL